MRCCIKCFNDTEIKAIIQGLNMKGNCDFCEGRNVYVYDLNTNKTLAELFDGLLDVYTPVSGLPEHFPKENLDLLKNILKNKWNIFNLESENSIYRLIKSICYEKYNERPELFDGPVGIMEITNQDYLEQHSILRTYRWNDFADEIKCKNRFHTNYINKDVLKMFIGYVRKTYKVGQVFYRARICPDETGFESGEMGAPPPKFARPGRANPEGISCLYLADSVKTALHEVRAGIYDYVSIGEFRLQEDIEVINFAVIDKISPFVGIEYTQHAINFEYLKKISDEIAKPLRRHDSTLDYLPTQYVSDYVKSLGFKGIEYKSTMCKNGFNLAIFDEKLFNCVNVTVYDIRALDYSYETV